MRTKFILAAVAGVAFVAGGITVGVLLTRGAPPAPGEPQVKAAEPDAKTGAVLLSEELGQNHKWQEGFAGTSARAIRHTHAGKKVEYAVELYVGLSNFQGTMTAETAVELVAYLKRVLAAKRPAKAVATEHYAYFKCRSITGAPLNYQFNLYTTEGVNLTQHGLENLEAALKDVEAMKKEDPAFVP